MKTVTTLENCGGIIQLKDTTYYLYDAVLRSGGKIIVNKGSWGNIDETGINRRITFDDIQTHCKYHSNQCRTAEPDGKKIITILLPHEKAIFYCGFHYFMDALTRRFNDRNEEVVDMWHP